MKIKINQLFRYEFHALSGKYNINLIKVILILWVTLLSLGISQGIMKQLANKMKSPFINWVRINIQNNAMSGVYPGVNVESIINELTDKNIISTYGLSNEKMSFIKTDRNVKAGNSPNGELINIETRTLNVDDPLFNELLKRNNLKSHEIEYSDEIPSVILSDAAVHKIFKDDVPHYLWIHHSSTGENMPIKVAAVFSQLPDFADVAMTSRLYNDFYTLGMEKIDPSYNLPIIWSPANHKSYIKYTYPFKITDSEKQTIEQTINSFLPNGQIKDLQFTTKTDLSSELTELTVHFNYPLENLNVLLSEKSSQLSLNKGFRTFEYDAPTDATFTYKNADYLCVKFDNIENIKGFANHLENKFNYKLNLTLIETYENYKSFEKTLLITSSTLVALSVVSLVIFIIGTIISHFERSKKTIGTIKAFGMSNRKLIQIYVGITFVFILIGLVISTILGLIIGPFLTKGITYLMKFNDVYGIDFNLNNMPVYTTLLTIVLGSVISVYYTLNSKFGSATPGDLVYERD